MAPLSEGKLANQDQDQFSLVCECTEECCGCKDHPGPSAFLAIRDKEVISLCTRCLFNTDAVMILTATLTGIDPMDYAKYDIMGFMKIYEMIQVQEEEILYN